MAILNKAIMFALCLNKINACAAYKTYKNAENWKEIVTYIFTIKKYL